MALKATVYKATLNIADMDRNYYQKHCLTMAKHPSETEERLMIRLLAFAFYADEALTFGKGISEDDATLYQKDLTGEIVLWIEIGQPRERTITRACIKAKQVVLFVYGSSGAQWWTNNQELFRNKSNLTVIQLNHKETQALETIADRNMNISCNIDEGQIMLISEKGTINIEPIRLQTKK